MFQDTNNRLKNMVVKLKEIMKCPVCLGSVGTTVVQCLCGHGVCARCRQQMNKCPLCKNIFMINKPILLTQILEQLPKLCQYNKQGCNEISFARDHELFCEYRMIKCKVGLSGECKWLGLVKDFKSHVQKQHNSFYASYPCVSPKKLYFKFFKSNWHTKHYIHIVDNNMFLLFAHKDQNSKRFFQVVKQVPLGQPNPQYHFTVTLGKQNCIFKHTIKACFIVDENEKLENSPYCMIVPIDEMDLLTNPSTGSLEVTYEAFKI